MPTDERSPAPQVPIGFRDLAIAVVRARFPAVAVRLDARPSRAHRLTMLLGVLAVVGLAIASWLLLRPADHPAVETVLPRAGAPAPNATGTGGSPAGSGTSGDGRGATGAVPSGSPASLVVHVVGAVAAPGVVRVTTGARVLDVVAAAGGLAPDADTTRVNLAAKVADGQRVVVPAVGAPVPSAVAGDGGADADVAGTPDPSSPVNLNEATAAQLDTLPGVGPATAAAIIAHRVQHGPFRSVDALGDVRGIGPAKLEQLRPLVTV